MAFTQGAPAMLTRASKVEQTGRKSRSAQDEGVPTSRNKTCCFQLLFSRWRTPITLTRTCGGACRMVCRSESIRRHQTSFSIRVLVESQKDESLRKQSWRIMMTVGLDETLILATFQQCCTGWPASSEPFAFWAPCFPVF